MAKPKTFKNVYAKETETDIERIRTFHLNDEEETEIENSVIVEGKRSRTFAFLFLTIRAGLFFFSQAPVFPTFICRSQIRQHPRTLFRRRQRGNEIQGGEMLQSSGIYRRGKREYPTHCMRVIAAVQIRSNSWSVSGLAWGNGPFMADKLCYSCGLGDVKKKKERQKTSGHFSPT